MKNQPLFIGSVVKNIFRKQLNIFQSKIDSLRYCTPLEVYSNKQKKKMGIHINVFNYPPTINRYVACLVNSKTMNNKGLIFPLQSILWQFPVDIRSLYSSKMLWER